MADSADRMQQWVEDYPTSPVSVGKALGEHLAQHPREFFTASLEILKTGARTPGHAHLVSLLVDNGLLPEALANPAQFGLDEAVEFFNLLLNIDPLLDAKLARWVLHRLRDARSERSSAAALRILGLLERTSTNLRLGPSLVQLLRLPDQAIRSKAVLLLGRSTHDARWALADPDPRVRANAVEAMWGVDTKEARRVLWSLARDPHNRVVGNALLALHKLGEPGVVDALAAMTRHPMPKFRATATWVIGQTRDQAFLEHLRPLEQDPDENVRRNARLALEKIQPRQADAPTAPPQLDDHASPNTGNHAAVVG